MIVLCDIDGTLANCDHRRKLLPNGKMDWAHFLNPDLVALDLPIVPVLNTVHALQVDDNYVIFVTGRHEGLRSVTHNWLIRHFCSLENDPPEILRMRKADDFRPDHIIKEEILDSIILDMGGPPHLVIDDRPSVLSMWRRRGIFTLSIPSTLKE